MSIMLPVASGSPTEIPPALIIPFGLLLLLIAVMPLSPARVKHFWEHYYPFVALGLGLVVGAYYLLQVPAGGTTILHTVQEYFSFICLIGSLFVVAGGIHLKVRGSASPVENVVFLTVGALATNLIGTTGASMLLIRPWIRMNQPRITAYHIVFFIFIIANCGGALTPIGDPPLFLGYLRGVPFFWLVEHAMLPWLGCLGLLLGVFYLIDRRNFIRLDPALRARAEAADTWRFEGGVNVLFLLVIVGAVFLPSVPFLREGVMIAAAVASYRLTAAGVHGKNEFSFGPIKEVAWLFIGIFLTMMPALDYLGQHGREFGFAHPLQYFFSTGALSAVLDNAPTYLNFLKLAEASLVAPGAGVAALLVEAPRFVVAVSLGAVFFGAMTYIGNGPNFMVKSIAESANVKVPTFFGYVFKYSLPVLLPILALVGWLFVR
ncbi:Citrate transporter [Lacunisphaera limnophila]|uniref:Citrate transporter n=1 Tax=Lacunisphaera limnophila TaxID=1838286 RepID=A0A1D8AX77_9BACT|nr:sodium:proton antiporter [Lacunisphaera limnophila]AOS45502.1 Citrate transporter [Lacunisphaera limnophila]